MNSDLVSVQMIWFDLAGMDQSSSHQSASPGHHVNRGCNRLRATGAICFGTTSSRILFVFLGALPARISTPSLSPAQKGSEDGTEPFPGYPGNAEPLG